MLRTFVALLGIATVAAGCGSQTSEQSLRQPAGAKDPSPPAAGHFSRTNQNAWFPLRPGTVLVYRGEDEGQTARDVFTVTHDTKVIQGVRCTVVKDRLYKGGRLAERTTDWYATADDGTVWYFGEATATFDRSGKLEDREGSWQSGVDGARAGIFMPGHPRVGQSGRQEYYKGHAEDHFTVVSLAAHATTPRASSRHALMTKEFTPLEPGVIDRKLFVRGIGTVIEQTIEGGNERFELVSIRRT